eukprot:s1118_g7.t1
MIKAPSPRRVDYANVTATVNEVSVRFSDVEPWGLKNQYFWVYSKSSLAEATTPYIHSIVDVDATVLNPQFVGQACSSGWQTALALDRDLDLNDLGGFVRWTPNGAPGVQDYLLYLAQSDMGANRPIPNGTTREPFDRFLVYARSSLAEQSTPKALGFVEAAQKFQVSLGPRKPLSDEDLDLNEVANYLTWTSPEVSDSVVDFRVFLAEDGLPAVAQGPMTELGDSTVEKTEFLVVYSRSSSMTQSTPSAVNVTDLDESVSNVRFEDYDLDPLDIGGGVNWTPPEPLEATKFYSDQTFEYRSIIAEVNVGEKHYEISAAPWRVR